MARTLPAPPFTGIDATIYSPFEPIIGHDDDQPERHWRPIARWLNAALAEGHAGTSVSMSWADGQAASDDPDWADKIDLNVPPAPSDSHTRLVVSMVVEPSLGLIRVRDANVGGAFVVVVPPDPGDPSPTAELREVELLAATPGGALLDVDASGIVEARSLECRWLPIEGVADDWPGDDDVLPAASIGTDPLDDDDVRPDDFGHSHTFVALYEAISSVQSRRAGRMAAAGWGAPLARRPMRSIVPVPQGGSIIVVKLRLEHDGSPQPGTVWIQHGRGGTGTVIDGRARPFVHEESVAVDTAVEVRTLTLDVEDELRVAALGSEYPGAAHLAVFADKVDIHAVTAWSR